MSNISGLLFNSFLVSGLWDVAMLAQALPLMDEFVQIMAWFLLIIGAVAIAVGGYLIAVRGQVAEGLLALLGGFFVAIAIPLMKYLMNKLGLGV